MLDMWGGEASIFLSRQDVHCRHENLCRPEEAYVHDNLAVPAKVSFRTMTPGVP